MVVGILSILKAGAAYLPIDTHYPQQRIRYMLADSNLSLLLTRGQLMDGPGPGIEIIDVSNEPFPMSCPLDSWGDSSHLAYVIYTSGSTGKPNGVLIEHRNILNYISWRISRYCQGPTDVSMQLVSVSFDGFTANLFPSLLSGGKAVLINENMRGNIDYLRTLILEQKVTNFSVVPSFYRLLLDNASKENFAPVRFVVLGGEKAWPILIEQSLALMPQAKLINEYGPTENSVTTTAHIGVTPDSVSIIGTPIANNNIFILDHEQNFQPIGVAGELFVTGAGLSRGYLNNPGLTSGKFYRSYRSNRTYILYKTGDLARWLPDGKIEILGRKDSQVKVRGVRIEVDEIENQLLKLAEIGQAVVMVKEDHDEGKFLCAYIKTVGEPNLLKIKNHLALNLPDYMIPAYFIRLEEIPLTPNGKLDKEKLSKMNNYMTNEKGYPGPLTGTQKKLAELWGQHLDIENIGIKENYFTIGGDSIKSIKLLQLVNQQFHTHLEIIDLYENETIEKMALKLDGEGIEKGNDQQSDLKQSNVLKEMTELKDKIIREKKEKEYEKLSIN
ncbi:MAG: non-ribosomal peptide synthetase [Acidobacteria bacterium]|nr:non-ribosomal peptide synthetase [Acidobacteriota bacterium]